MMQKNKILITEDIPEKAEKFLKDSYDTVVKKNMNAEELLNEIKDYEGLIVKSVSKIDASVLKEAERLKVIGRVGSGTDNIDLKAATRRGIMVVNAPMSNVVSSAELAIALMLAVAKKINIADKYLKSGINKKIKGIELEGKTLGIAGLGKIGIMVAKKAVNLGMDVIAYDPFISEDKFWMLNIKKSSSLEDLCKNADILTIHLPRNKETLGMIDKKAISVMKKGSIIINISRSGILVEDDLYEAIKSSHISGAGIDIFENETISNKELLKMEEVVCTPNLGASTAEAQEKSGIATAHQVDRILKNETPDFVVNISDYNKNIFDSIKPFMELCDNLGSLFAQLTNKKVQEVEVSFLGKIAELKTSILLSVILSKILQSHTDERINFVNANLIAEEMKIKVKEFKNLQTQDFVNYINLKGKAKDFSLSVSGTVTGIKNTPRFVAVDKFEIDMVPSRHMAFIKYQDIPGQIGRIGTAFGKLGVNIAAMHVGRKVVGGEALMGLNLDCRVTDIMLREFKNLSGFEDIKIINL